MRLRLGRGKWTVCGMASALWMRLREIDWSAAGVSEARGKETAKLLRDLASRKELRAMRASQQLWSLLGKDAALGGVVRPFLQEIRGISSAEVRGEIDELLGRG